MPLFPEAAGRGANVLRRCRCGAKQFYTDVMAARKSADRYAVGAKVRRPTTR